MRAPTPSRSEPRTLGGNVDATPASRSITVDVTAPPTTIDSGLRGDQRLHAHIQLLLHRRHSDFECRVDSGSFTACTSPHTTAVLGEGAHTFEVRAKDPVSNVDATPASRSITVDVTAPPTTIDGGPSGPTNDSTPTFNFSSTDGTATFECRVDSGSFAACTSPHTTPVLTDAAHTFEVRAKDAAGNVDATPRLAGVLG